MLEGPVPLLVIFGGTGSKFVPQSGTNFGAGEGNRTPHAGLFRAALYH